MLHVTSIWLSAVSMCLSVAVCRGGNAPTSQPTMEAPVFETRVSDGRRIIVRRAELPLPTTGPYLDPRMIMPVHEYRLYFTLLSALGMDERRVGQLVEADLGKNNFGDVDWHTCVVGAAMGSPDALVIAYTHVGWLNVDVIATDARGQQRGLLESRSFIESVGSQWPNQPAAAVIDGSFEQGGNVRVKVERNGGGVLRLSISRNGDKCEWTRVDPKARPAKILPTPIARPQFTTRPN